MGDDWTVLVERDLGGGWVLQLVVPAEQVRAAVDGDPSLMHPIEGLQARVFRGLPRLIRAIAPALE